MDAERSAAWVRRWVHAYTRGLPEDVRRGRIDEIEGDVWSQIHETEALSGGPTSIGDEIVARLLVGVPADLSWRLEQRGAAAPGPTPKRSPTMFARVIAAIAVIGGVAWATSILVAVSWSDRIWASWVWPWIMGSAIIGSVCLSIATIALVFANIDRLLPAVALLAAIGAGGGLLLVANFWQGPLIFLPIGSSILMLDLARLGIVRRWLARLQACVGLASVVPAVVLIASNGVTANGLPYLALLVTVVAYGLSWIPTGWSLRTGEWVAEAPEAHA